MIEALSAIVLGLSLAVPVGPICLEIMRKGLSQGFFSALSVGIGGITADLFFMVLIYFGLARFIMIGTVQLFLYLFGSSFLLYIGFQTINHRHRTVTQLRYERRSHLYSSYFTGLTIALINPINLMFWFGIYGSTLANLSTNNSTATFLTTTAFLFSGILIWNVCLAFLASFSGRFLNTTLFPFINIGAGICLLFFGFHFAYKLAILLF